MKLEKKDYRYIIFFLCLIIIFVSSFRLSDNKDLLEIISFSGNLGSIILAILAIVYAFIQSRESASQTKSVNDGLARINEKIAQFTSLKEELALIRKTWETQSEAINETVDEFKSLSSEFSELHAGIEEKDGSLPDDFKEKLEKIDSKINEMNSTQTVSSKYITSFYDDALGNIELTNDKISLSDTVSNKYTSDLLGTTKVNSNSLFTNKNEKDKE